MEWNNGNRVTATLHTKKKRKRKRGEKSTFFPGIAIGKKRNKRNKKQKKGNLIEKKTVSETKNKKRASSLVFPSLLQTSTSHEKVRIWMEKDRKRKEKKE
jgi:hypothetical protein